MEEDQIENQAKAQADRAGVAEMTVAPADETAAVAPAEMIGEADRVRRPLTVDLIAAVAGGRTAILKMAGVYAMLSVVAAVWGALQGPRFRIVHWIVRPEAVRRAAAHLELRRTVSIARFSTSQS